MFTKQRKAVIGGVAGALVLIGGGTLWWNHAKKVDAENAAWNASFDQAADNRNRAESDLIYGNEGRARTELSTAEQIIASLPTKSTDRQTKITKLKNEIADLKERLKKVVNIDTITELTTLPPGSADKSLVAPVLSKDTAYAADIAGSALLKVNLSTKEVKRIPIAHLSSPIVAATEGTGSILFATQDGSLFALNKSDDTVASMSWAHGKASSTKAIVLYASKIYSLDPEHNQIWRSQNSGGGFGAESAYIKAANASLADAISLAIDSNVYVLKSDGSLLQFLSGGQEGFNLSPIDPPLRSPTAVWTDADTTSIYISDPSEKRILIFDKSGNLKSQITSSQFRSPTAVSVNESNKRMIVIDGNRLLLVPLP